MITSRASLHAGTGGGASSAMGVGISVSASAHTKCERCWHYRADVGANAGHPLLCGRCDSNLFGPGEPREHA
jgi:isoleucyl-tRNA synthetase